MRLSFRGATKVANPESMALQINRGNDCHVALWIPGFRYASPGMTSLIQNENGQLRIGTGRNLIKFAVEDYSAAEAGSGSASGVGGTSTASAVSGASGAGKASAILRSRSAISSASRFSASS